MDIYKALNFLEKSSDEAEIYCSHGLTKYIIIEKNKIRKFVEKSFTGYGIRVVKDKRIGFISTNKLDYKTLENVIKISKYSERVEFFNLPDKKNYKKIQTYDPRLKYIDFLDLRRFSEDIISVSKELNVDISYSKIMICIKNIKLINSKGIDLSRKTTYAYCYIDAVFNNSTGFAIKESTYMDIDFVKLSYHACELALKSRDPVHLDKRKVNLVLKPYAVHELIEETLLHSFYADNIQRGRSLLKGKLNKRIFHPDLSIVEKPHLNNGLYSTGFDDEGIATKEKYLVKNGIIKSFLYNNYTAKKEGIESTGNGFRESYASLPGISPTNLIIEFKDKNIDYEDSLIVYGFIGTHTANPVTGDICVEVRNAFYNDKPVKKVLVYGNIFEMLNNIEAIGKNEEQYGFIISPEIKFKDIHISTGWRV